MTYLLDTDTFDHYHRGNANVSKRVSEIGLDQIAISVVTRMEVLQARFEYLRKAATAAQLRIAQFWLDDSDRWLTKWRITPFDEAACRQFDELRLQKGLGKIGRPDLPIACIAISSGATVVSRNVRDFKLVPRLHVENWVD